MNPRIEEILHKDWIVDVIGLEKSSEERGDFLGFRIELDGFSYRRDEFVSERLEGVVGWRGTRERVTNLRRAS